jgi:hypothetical protein
MLCLAGSLEWQSLPVPRLVAGRWLSAAAREIVSRNAGWARKKNEERVTGWP